MQRVMPRVFVVVCSWLSLLLGFMLSKHALVRGYSSAVMMDAVNGGEGGPSLAAYLDKIKPQHSIVETVTLASFINLDADTLEGEEAEEKRDFEAAFLQVVLHSASVTDAATHERSWNFSLPLGFARGKLLAVHRWKIWWAIPRLLKGDRGETAVPPQTYLLLGQLAEPGGSYVLLLPLVDKRMGFNLEGNGSALTVTGYDNTPESEDALALEAAQDVARGRLTKRRALLVSRGPDPLTLVRRSMKLAKEYLRREMGLERGETLAHLQDRLAGIKERQFSAGSFAMRRSLWQRGSGPAFVDSLGWCSWDSFYTDLSPDRILRGIDSFNDTGVRPGFVILDDGWQSTDVDAAVNGKQWGGRLASFQANFKFAPGYQAEPTAADADATKTPGQVPGAAGKDIISRHSLASLIKEAKDSHHVKHLLVWHTLSGYWAGVKPGPQADFDPYGAEIIFPSIPNAVHRASVADALRAEPFSTDGVGVVLPDKAGAFFDDYHATLRAMGVDGVKVDAQSVLALLQGPTAARGGGWGLVQAFHAALQNSLERNFGAADYPVIHCMCHSQDTMLSIAALYPDEDDDPEARQLRPVVRGSDDFWPADPASHGPHLYANAVNSLLFSHVGLHDWDMFQTALGRTSVMHAAARAVSGGPVYISDQPDKHDSALLRRMAFADGSVPRCVRNARPPASALFLDPQRHAGQPLLLQNANPALGLVLAAFSIAGAVLENDRDLFRFTTPAEMEWSHSGAQAQVDDWMLSHPDSENKKENKALYDDPAWAPHLAVDWTVGADDVEESRLAVAEHKGGPWRNVDDARPRWIAHRLSDGQLFGPEAVAAGAVPVQLPRVFDFEVVSLARVLVPEASADRTRWGAVIGAVDMLNPGGAVLSSLVHGWEGTFQATQQQQQKANDKSSKAMSKKTRPRTCPSLHSVISDRDLYQDLWQMAGTAAPSVDEEPCADDSASLEEEYERQLDVLEAAVEGGNGGDDWDWDGVDGSGIFRPQQDVEALRQGLVLEADLMGEGRFWFVAQLPGKQCRAELLTAKSLTEPDPAVTVSCREVPLQGVSIETVCLIELVVGRVEEEEGTAAGGGEDVRGLHVQVVVT